MRLSLMGHEEHNPSLVGHTNGRGSNSNLAEKKIPKTSESIGVLGEKISLEGIWMISMELYCLFFYQIMDSTHVF